jgi:hypothetical protein
LRSLTESEKVPSAAVEVPVVLPTTLTEAPETGAPSAPETFPFTTVCAKDDIAKNAIAQKPSRSFFLMQLIFVVNSNLSEGEYNNFLTFDAEFGHKCRFMKWIENGPNTQQCQARNICDKIHFINILYFLVIYALC